MRFTIADVVFVSESLSLTKEVFGKAASNLPKKYMYGHMSVDEFLSPNNDNTPTVLIVLLTPDMLASDRFEEFAKHISNRMSSRDARYFRTYIMPHGMSFEEFMKQCDSGANEGLNEIGDVVHLDRFTGPDEVISETVRFLDNEGNSRRFYGYVRFRNGLSFFTGLLSGILVWTCTIASYAMLILYYGLGNLFPAAHKYISDIFNPSAPTDGLYFWAMIMFGIALAIPAANIFHLLRFGFSSFIRQTLVLIRDTEGRWYFSGTYLGFIATINFIINVARPDWSLLLLSIAAGFCLDGIRRVFYIGRKGFLIKKIDKNLYTPPGKSIKRRLLDMGGNNILHALRLPYLPPKRTKVFISYTHSCEWSQKMADELYESFNKQNVICFVDKYGIARGSSWRLALHEKLISEATHAICLVSEKTAKKEWPAAEIETALKVRSITGIPNICVLLKEDMNVQETQSYTPVYKEIFNQETQERYGNLFVPVIRNTDGVVSELSKTLSYPDISSGVLGVWSAAWGMVWGLMELLTYYIKGIITVLAGMSFLVWLMVLTIQNRVDMSSMEAGGKALAIHIGNKIEDIVSSGFGLPVFLLACYLVSVELTQIIEGNFYVAYKTRIKSYLISQLIVLALSVACIYMALPCLPETYIILGFLFLMSGFFLTSGANDSVVDAGHCYYRNDSNRGTDTKRRLPG